MNWRSGSCSPMPYHLAKSPYSIMIETPRVGLEPTTTRLTAECSTIELSRIIYNKTTYLIRCLFTLFNILSKLHTDPIFLFDQALDRLVTVSSMRCRTSTSALSTLYSPRGLTGYLILRGASRLDAFSVYPFRTWLPCHAIG